MSAWSRLFVSKLLAAHIPFLEGLAVCDAQQDRMALATID